MVVPVCPPTLSTVAMPTPIRIVGLSMDARSCLKGSISSIIPCAARTAQVAWSGRSTGAPNTAISPSPIIIVTMPPWPPMASNINA